MSAGRWLWTMPAAALLLWEGAASAQVRWDVGAEVGALERFSRAGHAGAASPEVGPVLELRGHVAVVPMLRAGLYASADTSPTADRGTRTFWEGGLDVRLTPPLLPGLWRTWAFAGLGFAASRKGGYELAETVPKGGTVQASFASTDGSLLEAPFGLGIGYKLRGRTAPWMVFAELGGRVGVASFGGMYDSSAPPRGAAPGVSASYAEPFMGQDSFALSMTLGLSLDE